MPEELNASDQSDKSERPKRRWFLGERFQLLVGAFAVLIPAGGFLVFLAGSWMPLGLKDGGNRVIDDPLTDHRHIAISIGSCRQDGSPIDWPQKWLARLEIKSTEVQSVTDDPTTTDLAARNAPLTYVSQTAHPTNQLANDYDLTAFERSAIYHSAHLRAERDEYKRDAEERSNRLRRNQLRILCLSAAAAFVVGMRNLAKDTDLPFTWVIRGALGPMAALALLLPLLSTTLAGVVAFDDDSKWNIRDTRAVAQLEQLHGRIAENVTSDPFLCPLIQAMRGVAGPLDKNAARNKPNLLRQCLMDRMERTVAWQQRHEQILNDAMISLAQTGDLPRPGDRKFADLKKGPDDAAPTGDEACRQAFQFPLVTAVRNADAATTAVSATRPRSNQLAADRGAP